MWTLSEAQNLIAELQPVARRMGYVLALYGSVIERGAGRDCDLVAFPLPVVFSDASGLAMLLSLRVAPAVNLGCGQVVEPIYRRSPNTILPHASAFQFFAHDGKQVDLLILGESNGVSW